MPEWWRAPTGERGAAVIAGILHNQKRLIESGIVYSNGVIPNLPNDLGVEVPIVVHAAGLHPVSLGPLPDPIAKLLSGARAKCMEEPIADYRAVEIISRDAALPG